jgi:enoyl-CoA hydratase
MGEQDGPPLQESRRFDGAVAWLCLNRPGAMNSLNRDLAVGLSAAFATACADAAVKAVVLTGAGRAFCTGADLKALQAEVQSARVEMPDLLDSIVAAFNSVRGCEKPVIAALNGATFAGGLELALCCDVIFAARSARIGDGHSNYAMFPGGGSAAVLPARIGVHRAKALLFSGDDLPAETLEDWGLVYRVVPDAELEASVLTFAKKLAGKSARVLRGMKSVVDRAAQPGHALALGIELLMLRDHMRTPEFREGLAQFDRRSAQRTAQRAEEPD